MYYVSAAPYIRKLPTGETLCSWMGDWYDRQHWPEDRFDVYVGVGDKDGRNGGPSISQPFKVSSSEHALWNSVNLGIRQHRFRMFVDRRQQRCVHPYRYRHSPVLRLITVLLNLTETRVRRHGQHPKHASSSWGSSSATALPMISFTMTNISTLHHMWVRRFPHHRRRRHRRCAAFARSGQSMRGYSAGGHSHIFYRSQRHGGICLR